MSISLGRLRRLLRLVVRNRISSKDEVVGDAPMEIVHVVGAKVMQVKPVHYRSGWGLDQADSHSATDYLNVRIMMLIAEFIFHFHSAAVGVLQFRTNV
jgi:hypothetical protein